MNFFRNYRSIILILLAVLFLMGDNLGLPWISQIILTAVGLAAIIGGIRISIQGEAYEGMFSLSNFTSGQQYSNLSAWLIGLSLGLGGLLILALSLIDLFSPGGASTFISDLLDSSFGLGIVFGISGLMIAVYGVIRLLSGIPTRGGTHNLLGEFGAKAGGLISTVIGLIFLGLSFGWFLSPGFLRSLGNEALGLIEKILK